jgi:predicted RNA binding protein YcfA (HicA-like mRNA interferase family)
MRMERDSRKLIRLLETGGWYLADVRGDHHQYCHPTRKGRVTVPHPNKDIAVGTLRSIYRQAGWLK